MFSSSKSSGSTSFLGGGGESSSNPLSRIPGFEEEPACAKMCPQMSYQHRLIGFACCAAFGWILSIIGALILIGGASASNIRLFIVFYVLGNVVSLCSTGFLLGPRSQCGKMWAVTRRWSTAFYLSMLIIVFCVAITGQNIFLIFFLLFVEICAALWYTLSYVPFGRKIFMAFLRKTGACMPCFYVYDEYIAPCQEKVNETVATNTKSSGNNETIAQKLGVAEKKDTSVSGRMSGMFKGSNKV